MATTRKLISQLANGFAIRSLRIRRAFAESRFEPIPTIPTLRLILEAEEEALDGANDDGLTPLHFAAMEGHVSTVR